MICKIINVEERVITLTETKIESDNCSIIHLKQKNPKSNSCFIIDFKPKIINMARKTVKTNIVGSTCR